MITPKFKLDQDANHLYINIRVPYANLNEVETCVDKNDFRFYCKPYYLRLNLPGEIKDESESSKYDVDENTFKFTYLKMAPGENFDGLDLITKLLTPVECAKKTTTVLIEEVSTNGEDVSTNQDEEDDDEDGNRWFIDQTYNNEPDVDEMNIGDRVSKYGFALTKSKVFSKLSDEYLTVIDLPSPDDFDKARVEKRTQLRIENENEKFDEDHYLADFFDDTELIDETLLKYTPTFYSIGTKEDVVLDYTDKEIDVLKALPRRTYLLDKSQKLSAYLGLVDILFAYCYNNRINCGEKNVESGWTIAKLSSTLSWFDTFKSLEECVMASFRRSLCYPLYRNWELSEAVLKDLVKIFSIGRKMILKCLLEIRESFIDGDCRYVLNDLYINDYCVWVQQASEKKLTELKECLSNLKIQKKMAGFELEELEFAGELALKEHEENGEDEDEDDDDDDDESDSSEDESVSENETKPIELTARPNPVELKGNLVGNEQEDGDEKADEKVDRELVIDFETLRLTSKNDPSPSISNTTKPKIIELN